MPTVAMAPSWLYELVGVVTLLIAAYSLALIGLGVQSRRTAGWDVELSHALMGIAMAGMFVGGLAVGRRGMWEALFAAALVWFVVRAGRSILAYGLHLPHTAVHALMSLAMLLMYWFPRSGARSASRADPGLLLIVATLLLASAVFTFASTHRGATVYGAHPDSSTGIAMSVAAGGPSGSYLIGTTAAVSGADGAFSRPWLLDATHVVMCVAMAFMLILML